MAINYLTGKNKNKESVLLKKASEVTSDNQDTPLPQEPEAKKPFGGWGDAISGLVQGATGNNNIMSTLLSTLMGGMGGNNAANNTANTAQQQPVKTPDIRRPLRFGARVNRETTKKT